MCFRYVDIINGDYVKARNVDFKKVPKLFEGNVNPHSNNGSIEIHFDRLTGPLSGTLMITRQNSNSLNSRCLQSCKVGKVKGSHDVYFVICSTSIGGNLGNR